MVEDHNFQADQSAPSGADWRVLGPADGRMAPQVRQRRRRSRRTGRALVRSVLPICLALGLAGGGMAAWAKPAILSPLVHHGMKMADEAAQWAGFGVVQVSLKGHRFASDMDIFEALGNTTRKSIIGFDLPKAREDLARLAWIKEADITRRFPDQLVVRVEERAPYAVWESEGRFWLIDRNGRKLAPVENKTFADLPYVTGAGANTEIAAFRDLLKNFSNLDTRLYSISRIGGRRWTLTLKTGLVVHLPAEQPKPALSRLNRLMLENQTIMNGRRIVDLRLPDRIIIQKVPLQTNSNLGSGRDTGVGADRTVMGATILTPSESAVLAPFQERARPIGASSQHPVQGG